MAEVSGIYRVELLEKAQVGSEKGEIGKVDFSGLMIVALLRGARPRLENATRRIIDSKQSVTFH